MTKMTEEAFEEVRIAFRELWNDIKQALYDDMAKILSGLTWLINKLWPGLNKGKED